MLAIALADGVFKDYTTFEEIFAIPPPADGALHHLEIHESKRELPFFQSYLVMVRLERSNWRAHSAIEL